MARWGSVRRCWGAPGVSIGGLAASHNRGWTTSFPGAHIQLCGQWTSRASRGRRAGVGGDQHVGESLPGLLNGCGHCDSAEGVPVRMLSPAADEPGMVEAPASDGSFDVLERIPLARPVSVLTLRPAPVDRAG